MIILSKSSRRLLIMVWVEVQLPLSDQLEKHPVRWTGVSRLQLLVGHQCCRREDLRVPAPSSCCLLCFGSFFTVKNHTRHLKLQNTIHWEQEKYFKMLIKFNMHWGEKSLLSVDGIYYVPLCVFLATEISVVFWFMKSHFEGQKQVTLRSCKLFEN